MTRADLTPARPTLPSWRALRPAVVAVAAELCLVVVAYQIYAEARIWVAGEEAVAIAHGRALLEAERALGLAFEQPLQHLALRVPGLVQVCNYLYVGLHRPFLGLAAVLLYIRDRRRYARARRAFFLSCAIGLVIFWAMPVAPPRLLPDAGFVDTLRLYLPAASYQPGVPANQFAALPSFHFGWDLLLVSNLSATTTRRSLRMALALPPMLMLLTIVITANHLWIDALAGACVVGIAYALAGWLEPGRLLAARSPETATMPTS